MQNVEGQHAIHDAPSRGNKITTQTEQGGIRNFILSVSLISKIRDSHRDFFLFGVKWYIKSSFLRFY